MSQYNEPKSVLFLKFRTSRGHLLLSEKNTDARNRYIAELKNKSETNIV